MAPGEERDLPIGLVDEPATAAREHIDNERIGTLADDIAVNGLLQRPGVRGPLAGGRYEIIWGHRRLLALRSLRWETIPVKIYPAEYDPDVARVAENLQREELTPIEEGRECAKFISKGHTRGQVARLFRRSVAWVDSRLDLLALPPDLQEAINTRTINASVARILGQVDHDGYRRSLIQDAVTMGATVGTAELWLQQYRVHGARLVRNEITIEQMVQERESFKIMVPCQGCGDDTDYQHTQSLRLCTECVAAVSQVFERLASGEITLR